MIAESSPPFVWILNADVELEAELGSEYTPKKKTSLRMAEQRDKFLALTNGEPAYFPFELPKAQSLALGAHPLGLPWCGSLSVTRLLERLGYRQLRRPENSLLRTVLSREFLVRSTLPGPPGRTFVRTSEELRDAPALKDDGEVYGGGTVRTKRAYGAAGRGHRLLRGRLVKDDQKFLQDGLEKGGLVVEPELPVRNEYSLHGWIGHGEALFGGPCRVEVDEFFAPLSVTRAPELAPEKLRALARLQEEAAHVLAGAGYFGPFGVDLLETEEALFVSDLNARFTLGWSVGMGEARDLALQKILSDVIT